MSGFLGASGFELHQDRPAWHRASPRDVPRLVPLSNLHRGMTGIRWAGSAAPAAAGRTGRPAKREKVRGLGGQLRTDWEMNAWNSVCERTHDPRTERAA
ncbi:unnamed protein product [Rangifer tarandus platyrhynchus]|uniref:Uncharacterized protein n=1 Tax=Rangifer tarandus platyrhynchus TaxID=3082113 RepID=A0ACB1MJ47_RANTA